MSQDEESIHHFGVGGVARIEGGASLGVTVADGVVTEVALEIFEPPRLFEALLVGRHFTEAPDITARICGICPVAYQMTACAAMEDACGITVHERIVALRRLLYCGEWIQSHALHIYLLHAPDFLGYSDAVELARHDRDAVARGFQLKHTGDLVMRTVGARSVHPVNVRVGGFYRAPDTDAIAALADPLRRARDDALATIEWASHFDFPEVSAEYRFVALRDTGRYPVEGGRPGSSEGLDVTPNQFADLVVEEHAAHSTALHAHLAGAGTYLTGPLARYALNGPLLPPLAAEAATRAGLEAVCVNPYRSILVRGVELVFACEEALSLVETYEPPRSPAAELTPRAGTGTAATEAPRGLLLHQYDIDADGIIRRARIVAPTSQNQASIEADLRAVAQAAVTSGDDLQTACEQAVRNHDPCISCAAHFLDLTLTEN